MNTNYKRLQRENVNTIQAGSDLVFADHNGGDKRDTISMTGSRPSENSLKRRAVSASLNAELENLFKPNRDYPTSSRLPF
jgi:hypothetical protein